MSDPEWMTTDEVRELLGYLTTAAVSGNDSLRGQVEVRHGSGQGRPILWNRFDVEEYAARDAQRLASRKPEQATRAASFRALRGVRKGPREPHEWNAS